jgi:hypothetical protein
MTDRVMTASYVTIAILVAVFVALIGGLYLNMQILRATQSSAVQAQAEAAEAARKAAIRAQYPPVTDYLDIRDLQLVRKEGRLWVKPSVYSGRPFEGRFRVVLRDATGRHYFTPRWSGWQNYEGPKKQYREYESIEWWAGAAMDGPVQDGIEGSWTMETCWELRERVPDDGTVFLGVLCAETKLEAAQ